MSRDIHLPLLMADDKQCDQFSRVTDTMPSPTVTDPQLSSLSPFV